MLSENAKRLFAYVRSAFVSRTIAPLKAASKRRPVRDGRTGPAAAAEWERLHVSSRSSIRKRLRVGRIAAGKRPFKFDVAGKRETALLRKSA